MSSKQASWWRSWAFLRRRCRGSGAPFGDFAVDQQPEPVLEGHVAEVVPRHLFEEGGLHAGQAQ